MNADSYVDGWLAAVPTANQDAYRQHAIMDDPRLPKDMPFDGKRLIFGGFCVLLVS